MNKQQGYLFGLVKEIRDICDAHGITYFLGFGTLLGAVRNEGFLPWDDDADIIMTNDEFLRFAQVCETCLPDNRCLGYFDADITYGHLMPRYISTDTTAIHTAQSLNECAAGELIDIFVLDPIADGDEAYETYKKELGLYTTAANYANACATRFETDAALYERFLEIREEDGLEKARKWVSDRFSGALSESGSRYALRWQGAPLLFDRAWFESAVPVQMKGETFNAPMGYNGFFKVFYGEEWTEIPGRITASKHNTAASLDFGYKDALEFYRPTFDRDELLSRTEKRRLSMLEKAHEANELADEVVQARAELIGRETCALVERNKPEFDEALKDDDLDTLGSLLGGWLSWQTSADAIGRCFTRAFYRYDSPVLAPVGDEIFDAGLVVLLGTDQLRFVHRLLDIRKKAGLVETETMKKLSGAIDRYNGAVDDLQLGRLDVCREAAMELRAQYPKSPAFARLLCWCLKACYDKSEDAADLEELAKAADLASDTFPEEGVFLKYRADVIAARDELEAARDLYIQAAETTRNGIALHGIAKATGYYPSWIRDTRWGRRAGVPQWDGSTPDLPQPGKASKVRYRDAVCEYLLSLVRGCADACEDAGVPWKLADSLDACLLEDACSCIEYADFAIYCQRQDIGAVFDALQKRGSADRLAVLDEESEELVYYGLDSLCVDMHARLDDSPHALCVRVHPSDEGFGESDSSDDAKSPSQLALDSMRQRAVPVVLGEGVVVSTIMNLESAFDEGIIDRGYFDRRRAYSKGSKFEREVMKDFRFNYQQIKLAVQLKQLSLDLMPKKERLLALESKGDVKRLKKEFKSYLACDAKFSQYGVVSFDDDLYALMQRVKEGKLRPRKKERAIDSVKSVVRRLLK